MNFKWLNESDIVEKNNRIEIFAPAQSDFFLIMAQLEKKVLPLIPLAMLHSTLWKWQEIL